MPSTQRQKEQAKSRDISGQGNDLVAEDEQEQASNFADKDGREKANDDDSDSEIESTKELVEGASELFVLDHTGEQENVGVSSIDQDNREVAKGYGLSLQRKSKRRRSKGKSENPLSKLLPGYTAPMKLDTSSLDKYRAAGGIKELQWRAQLTDASTRNFVIEATKDHVDVMQSKANGLVASSYTDAYSSFKKGKKRTADNTAGKGWFGMTPTPMTEELKADLAVIRNRNYLDPKKFYKSADKQGSVVQLGTVIEGASEYYSARLTKKQRRSNITEEIMADPQSADYARKKFRSMAQEKTREAKQRSRVHRPKRGKRMIR